MPHLSPAVASGEFVFTSGQLGFGPDGRIVEGGIAAQTAQAIANIAALLAAEGLSLADIVKTTVWITDYALFAPFDAAYATAFGAHKPARSTTISALVVPQAQIELEAIARRRAGGAP